MDRWEVTFVGIDPEQKHVAVQIRCVGHHAEVFLHMADRRLEGHGVRDGVYLLVSEAFSALPESVLGEVLCEPDLYMPLGIAHQHGQTTLWVQGGWRGTMNGLPLPAERAEVASGA